MFRLGGRAVLFVGLLLLAYHTSLLPFELLGKTSSASPVQQQRGTNVERSSKPKIQWRRPISEVTLEFGQLDVSSNSFSDVVGIEVTVSGIDIQHDIKPCV